MSEDTKLLTSTMGPTSKAESHQPTDMATESSASDQDCDSSEREARRYEFSERSIDESGGSGRIVNNLSDRQKTSSLEPNAEDDDLPEVFLDASESLEGPVNPTLVDDMEEPKASAQKTEEQFLAVSAAGETAEQPAEKPGTNSEQIFLPEVIKQERLDEMNTVSKQEIAKLEIATMLADQEFKQALESDENPEKTVLQENTAMDVDSNPLTSQIKEEPSSCAQAENTAFEDRDSVTKDRTMSTTAIGVDIQRAVSQVKEESSDSFQSLNGILEATTETEASLTTNMEIDTASSNSKPEVEESRSNQIQIFVSEISENAFKNEATTIPLMESESQPLAILPTEEVPGGIQQGIDQSKVEGSDIKTAAPLTTSVENNDPLPVSSAEEGPASSDQLQNDVSEAEEDASEKEVREITPTDVDNHLLAVHVKKALTSTKSQDTASEAQNFMIDIATMNTIEPQILSTGIQSEESSSILEAMVEDGSGAKADAKLKDPSGILDNVSEDLMEVLTDDETSKIGSQSDDLNPDTQDLRMQNDEISGHKGQKRPADEEIATPAKKKFKKSAPSPASRPQTRSRNRADDAPAKVPAKVPAQSPGRPAAKSKKQNVQGKGQPEGQQGDRNTGRGKAAKTKTKTKAKQNDFSEDIEPMIQATQEPPSTSVTEHSIIDLTEKPEKPKATACHKARRRTGTFPRYNTGEVYIELAHLDETYCYAFSSATLENCSDWFKSNLYGTVDEVDSKEAHKFKMKAGYTTRYELKFFLDKQEWLLCRAPITYVVDNDGKTTRNSQTSDSPMQSSTAKSEDTLIELENHSREGDEAITRRGRAPLKLLETFDSLFRAYHNISPNIDRDNIDTALTQSEHLLTAADIYGGLSIVSTHINNILNQYGQEMYKAIRKDAPRWIYLAIFIKSAPIFKEAMVHIVGTWPTWTSEFSFDALPTVIRNLIVQKASILKEMKRDANQKLCLSTVRLTRHDHFIMLDPKDTSSFGTWVVSQLWHDWLRHSLRKLDRAGEEGFGDGTLYRLLSKGSDSYLPFAKVYNALLAFEDESTAKWKWIPQEVEEDLRVMKNGAIDMVKDLVVNQSMLPDIEGIRYLTCTKIENSELPWTM